VTLKKPLAVSNSHYWIINMGHFT